MIEASADLPDLAAPRALRLDKEDGSFILRSPEPLGSYDRCIGDWVERWAVETPDAVALVERAPSGEWHTATWRELRRRIGSIAQALISMDLPAGKPVVIVSDNAVDHALLMLASLHVGRPVCSVSSAYARTRRDFGKIAGILHKLDPGLVYASDQAVYGAALAASRLSCPIVFSQGAEQVDGAIAFDRLAQTLEGPEVMGAFRAIAPDDTAKYLLTSGSTGHPKVVVNTHRMLCANQQMIAQAWRFLAFEKPVLLDWLPWSHTFGGNHNFNLVLRHGGTLYIDDGRPVAGLIEKTVRNAREVRPTLCFNVPRGFDMLLPYLEADLALARDVLSRMTMLFYAGAALPNASWQRLEALARKVRDRPLWMTTSWGSTETSPAVTSAHWRLESAGCIGGPLPGLEIKFVPNGRTHELRVRGVSVFPGYRDEPDLTRAAFDEDGFYRIGDAGALVDPDRPERGIRFDGRVAEDFKLSSGTWVSVGSLRVALVSALAPYAQDAVVTGHDRDEVGALVFPSAAAVSLPADELQSVARRVLLDMRSRGQGSASCPTRLLFLEEPPDVEAGEITDKGYINQRDAIDRRAAEVALLYETYADPRVIRV